MDQSIKEGDLENVLNMMEQGYPEDCKNRKGLTPFQSSIYYHKNSIMSALFERGLASLESQESRHGLQPIHIAFMRKNYPAVDFLLSEGINTSETLDGNGHSLKEFCQNRHIQGMERYY